MRVYPQPQVQAAFEAKYIPEPNSGCWLWLGALNNKGYAQLAVAQKRNGTRSELAHRLAFTWAKGPIPTGKVLDHLCRVTCCVNPDHLDVVTQRVNILRGESLFAKNAVKTHCKRGHLLDALNTYRPPGRMRAGKPARQCAECRRQAKRRHWLENK